MASIRWGTGDPPKDLVEFGYISDAEIKALRQAKIRCWYDRDNLNPIEVPLAGDPSQRVRKRKVWVEPITQRIAELYRKDGQKFAGLTEVEFVIRTSPEKEP